MVIPKALYFHSEGDLKSESFVRSTRSFLVVVVDLSLSLVICFSLVEIDAQDTDQISEHHSTDFLI